MENTGTIRFEHIGFGKKLKSMLSVDFRRMFTTPLFYIMVGVCLAIPILILVMTTMLNKAPPAKHRTTFRIVESKGVIMDTMLKNNIPMQREAIRESHNFCLPKTLINT